MPQNKITITKDAWTLITDAADSPVLIAFGDGTSAKRVHLYKAAAAPAANDTSPIDDGETILMDIGRASVSYPRGITQSPNVEALYGRLESAELVDSVDLVVQE